MHAIKSHMEIAEYGIEADETKGMRATATLSIVMPCLNEAASIGTCVDWALGYLAASGLQGEVVVADNGSTDGSPQIATARGAVVVAVPRRGYGTTLRAGIAAARGDFVIMGDSDASYDFRELDGFIAELSNGADIVVGNRFRGGISKGAMPILHRYVGNPILSLLARALFGIPLRDVYCGLRGVRRQSFAKIGTKANGMEFALEMLIRARRLGMHISEVPTTLLKDQRGRGSHLRTWGDGLRSLGLYLSFSPRWALIFPGGLLLTSAFLLGLILTFGSLRIGELELSVHTLAYCGFGVLIGFQTLAFGLFAQVASTEAGGHRLSNWTRTTLALFQPRTGLFAGSALLILGLGLSVWSLYLWRQASFEDLNPFLLMRIVIPAATLTALGLQVYLTTLYLTIIRFHRRSSPKRPTNGER
jgi:glycosyltransferase involved in cell wall biosynthesis